MLKKLFYWTFTVLQALLLIAAYAVQYFSTRRMGMMRYLVYKNQLWQSQYPINLLRYTAVLILIILALICLVLYYKNRISGKKTMLPLSAALILTIIFVFFTLAFSPSGYRAYYLICIMLAAAAIIQDIKVIMNIK